jgi:putative pyruvate formate lyase activating enzyme
MIIYTAFLHTGEEPPLITGKGSGTIFFSGCNLKCCYCQNYKFSHTPEGRIVSEEECGRIMLNLQKKGAANINLVTPTHYLPLILNALRIAFKNGLDIPLVYNTSGYEKTEIIRRLKGIVDVYLADVKYISGETAGKYSRAENYPFYNQESLREMYRQKPAVLDADTLKEGLIVRHLVLPGHSEETRQILCWIKKNMPDALVSIMFQYQPYFEAAKYPEINRIVSLEEFTRIKELVDELGLPGWVQEYTPEEKLAGVYFEPLSEDLLE